MYDQIARFYDLTHNSLTEDVAFILSLAAQTGGPALELGCGTGRLLLPLAQAGFSVTGVDNSAAMLALARRKLAAHPDDAQNRVQLAAGDMANLPLLDADGRFQLALIPYNTFLHLNSAQKSEALRGVKRVLRADGRLFIDLTNPFIMAATPNDNALILENSLTDPETGDLILQLAANRLDAGAQILHITWIYDVSSVGGMVRRTAVSAAYHYLFPHQMELLLANAGFRLANLAGEYDQSPFSEESSRLLVTAAPR